MWITYKLCEAIASYLKTVELVAPCEITAAWSIPYEPLDLSGIRVTVAPDQSRQTAFLSRRRDIQETHKVSVLIQQKVTDLETSLILPVSLQQSIDDQLRWMNEKLELGDYSWALQAGTVSGFVRRHLDEFRVYTGFLDLNYSGLRT